MSVSDLHSLLEAFASYIVFTQLCFNFQILLATILFSDHTGYNLIFRLYWLQFYKMEVWDNLLCSKQELQLIDNQTYHDGFKMDLFALPGFDVNDFPFVLCAVLAEQGLKF